MNGKSEMQWNAEEQALLVKDEEARRGEITETVAIPQLERIDGQTASSFLLLIIKSSAFSSFAERELDTIRSPSVSAG